MIKNSSIQYPKQRKNREIASIIADIHKVSTRYVRMVINGEEENEKIFSSVMEYLEGKNLLIESIKQAVPFEK